MLNEPCGHRLSAAPGCSSKRALVEPFFQHRLLKDYDG
jgi:hypothetical protein